MIGRISDAVGWVPEYIKVIVVLNGSSSSTAASAMTTSSVLRVLWESMSWAEFQRVGTSCISFLTGNPNSSCFSFRTCAAPGERRKWPTSLCSINHVAGIVSDLYGFLYFMLHSVSHSVSMSATRSALWPPPVLHGSTKDAPVISIPHPRNVMLW